MRLAVVTIVHGRHAHLRRQRAALAALPGPPDSHVVVAMDDREIPTITAETDLTTTVVDLPRLHGRLPLAAARNAGAAATDADLLIFLDVDCLPGAELLTRYAAAAGRDPTLLAGPVGYLPAGVRGGTEAELRAAAMPSPVRPVVPDGSVIPSADTDLFWSLSFAATRATWARVGGFCADYTGYGMEDTDFAWSAREVGVGLAWVGGAWAYHLDHGASGPTAAHAADLVRNAAVFHRRWGRWPAAGWFDALERDGLVRRDDTGRPHLAPAAAPTQPVDLRAVTQRSRPSLSRWSATSSHPAATSSAGAL